MSIVNVEDQQKSKLNAQTFDTVLCSRSRLRASQPNLGFVVVHDDSDVNNENNLLALCPNCHWELDNGKLRVEQILE